jgi:hypothetical protein
LDFAPGRSRDRKLNEKVTLFYVRWTFRAAIAGAICTAGQSSWLSCTSSRYTSRQGIPAWTRKRRVGFTPHFKHVKVRETIYPTRHNLYLAASQQPIEIV